MHPSFIIPCKDIKNTRKPTRAQCAYPGESRRGDCEDITIVVYELPMENWGIRGGKPANEVNLGFKVDV
ncbi:MAG TPA: hypothetical protein DIW47_06940 [Bacteroidetes bacterium]|nr:hypothetical protein [Bacteroidota bacterium]